MSATASYAHLEDEVLHLSREDRSRLASKLLQSLEEDEVELSPEWRQELQRRVEEVDKGKANLIPAKEVWDGINRRFGTDF